MSKPLRRALCWIRRDLRLQDHAALAAATAAADEVAVVFVFDRNILDALADRDDRRVTFIHQSLVELDEKLSGHGSRLLVRHGDPVEEIPAVAEQFSAEAVFTARDAEPYAIRRDESVRMKLERLGIHFQTVKDTVIFEGDEILGPNGSYRVYTPYARAWRKAFVRDRDAAEYRSDLTALVRAHTVDPLVHPWTLTAIGFRPNEVWLTPGEDAARERLENFLARMDGYAENRDIPAIDGTSTLSVDLRFGTLSIRELVRQATSRESAGAEKWFSELIWREFYCAILRHHPHVVSRPFQAQYDAIDYPGLPEHFEAWCEGKTGYPLIDAAMRCLKATGWMHNRLRMIVASFLTKDLLIDYRQGEAHFARYLLDFDLASNNGGWQWAASTGTDPQPYFRIFNPTSQSEKFDPEGVFIREWVPELRELSPPALHAPWTGSAFDLQLAGVVLGETYPRPIVDHATQRDRAINLLASLKSQK